MYFFSVVGGLNENRSVKTGLTGQFGRIGGRVFKRLQRLRKRLKMVNEMRFKYLFVVVVFLVTFSFGNSYYHVCNVDSNDSLNVRTEANNKSPVVTSLPSNASGIEALSRDGNWVKIVAEGKTGWVHNHYLKKSGLIFYDSLFCFGTEPHWIVSFSDNTIEYDNPEDGKMTYGIHSVDESANNTNVWHVFAGNNKKKLSVFLIKTACSDGMSDNRHSYKLLLYDEYTKKTYNGCCNEFRK